MSRSSENIFDVFVQIETCRKVENALKRMDRKEARIRVLSFHAALAQDARLANLKEFLGSQSADSMFLVCTDRYEQNLDLYIKLKRLGCSS